jgi:hypothetical protein
MEYESREPSYSCGEVRGHAKKKEAFKPGHSEPIVLYHEGELISMHSAGLGEGL